MKNQKKTIRGVMMSIALIVTLIIVSILSGRGILHRMQSYIETNGKNNMATIMEQISNSYDIQVESYFGKLEQTEKFLFRGGERALSLEECKRFFDTVAPMEPESLLFMKENGEVTTIDGRNIHLDLQSQILIDLNQGQRIVQSISMNTNERAGNYFLLAIPCETYRIDGEEYDVIASLYDLTDIDSMLELNGYGGEAYLFLVDENGIVSYTNQPGEAFYRNYALLKQLRKDRAISDAQYDDLSATIKSNRANVDLFDQNEAPFYLGCHPVTTTNHRLICIVPKSTVDNSLVEYQKLMMRSLGLFMVLVLLLCIALICNLFRLSISNKKMAYEKEKRQIQETAMKELEIARNKADGANRAKSDFLANMSHDIRTPMNAIVGITRLMAHDKNDPAKIDAYIHKVQQSSQHLLSLINDVLDMSKIESGEVSLNVEPVALADQVWQIESIVRPQIEEREQHFVLRTRNVTHEHLIGDAVRLRQVFINLLSNAIKYTPNGGDIQLDLEELPCETPDFARLRIAVTDSGYGMTPEFVQHIFEPFTRAENSTTNRVQGTGLGMAITKNIVDLAGGTISVRSEVEKGSCFTVELPFQIDRETKTVLPIQTALLITDEKTLINNAQAAFWSTDATLLVATSPAEADDLLRQNAVDIVLLSSRLGGDTLPEHLDQVREKTGTALLFYCCEYEDRDQISDLGEHGGVDGVLIRPFFLSSLARAIDRAHSEAAEEAAESVSILNGMRFLCAEDNALNAEILQAVLDMNGASCVIYPDGQKIVEAFRTVQPEDFDAILMDVQMPNMNGLDATRAIRHSENPLGKTIPIIAMTANAFSEDVQNCLNAGMDAHVSKPLDIAVLERTIKSISNGKFAGGGTFVSISKTN